MKTMVCTRMPGRRYCTYSFGEPARAPPKRNVNISVNMMGIAVTSKSWKGTCLILSSARQPSVTTAPSALAGRGRSRLMRMRGSASVTTPSALTRPPPSASRRDDR
jgi:hypothetical protein